jgi:hypothetical protein
MGEGNNYSGATNGVRYDSLAAWRAGTGFDPA